MAKQRSRVTGSIFKRGGRGCWIATYTDADGRRRERSTRTTDKGAAERILSKLVADAALRRDGVIDARQDRFIAESRKPLAQHIAEYLDHCRHAGHAAKAIDNKQRHLGRLVESLGDGRMAVLTADALERYLRRLRDEGQSARTWTLGRQVSVAFASWCVKQGRLESNPLSVVPKLNEQRDRRRVRRPLTDAELARLIDVARERGHEAWYLTCAFAGLRKGDLQRLTWADVDFTNATLTVREAKAKRVDTLPMDLQLVDALRRRLAERPAVGSARVFPETATDLTRRKDFERAGIPLVDDDGRVADLHALRTTLGTQLARAGVTPQVAQRMMRHSDYRTTLSHYTVLGLADTAGAVAALPSIGTADARQATGAIDTRPENAPPRIPQQLQGQGGRFVAQRGTSGDHGPSVAEAVNTRKNSVSNVTVGMERRRLERPTSSLQSWHSTS